MKFFIIHWWKPFTVTKTGLALENAAWMRQTANSVPHQGEQHGKVGAEGSTEPQISGSSVKRQAEATQLDDSGEQGEARAHDTVETSHSNAQPVETHSACW